MCFFLGYGFLFGFFLPAEPDAKACDGQGGGEEACEQGNDFGRPSVDATGVDGEYEAANFGAGAELGVGFVFEEGACLVVEPELVDASAGYGGVFFYDEQGDAVFGG